jgi:asparagine synthase (glutamine-hydrolysing)
VVVARVHRPFVHGVELALHETYRRMAADGRGIAFSGQASDVCWGDQDGSDFPILDLRGPVDIHSEFYLKNRLYRTERPLWHVMLDRIMQHLGVRESEVTERIWERTFALYRGFSGVDPHKRARFHILGRFSVYVNEMIEALSSGFGIVERTPFQDVELIDLSFRLPEFVKNHHGISEMKPFLKLALAEIVPREIVDRPKQGFPPPDDSRFVARLRELVTGAGLPFDAEFPPEDFQRLGAGELLYLYSAQHWLRHNAGLAPTGG